MALNTLKYNHLASLGLKGLSGIHAARSTALLLLSSTAQYSALPCCVEDIYLCLYNCI